ncbi:MAG: SsrA-binding protein SmpB [Actinomycetota bacterium]|nr:SsrA-binding protein SmpB [Actinomycetota bacterium]
MARGTKGSKQKKPADGRQVVATNRQARRDYEIIDTLECGIVLKGSEVKALREAKVQLNDTYARVERGELWLLGLHIAPYSHGAGAMGHDPDRRRKLLAHRAEIERWSPRLDQEHLTLVPLSLYFRKGNAKLEVGLARGRRQYDKRQVIAQRDADREAERAMARGMRGRQG